MTISLLKTRPVRGFNPPHQTTQTPPNLPSPLQFGSKVDEVRFSKNPQPSPQPLTTKFTVEMMTEALKAENLCDAVILPGNEQNSLKVIHFLADLIEKRFKTIAEMTQGLNLTPDALQTLQQSLEALETKGIVAEEFDASYGVTDNGYQALRAVYPDQIPDYYAGASLARLKLLLKQQQSMLNQDRPDIDGGGCCN